VIISAGFREAGEAGVEREQAVLDIARRYGMRLVGPNSLGVIDALHGLNVSFSDGLPPPWEVGVFSHSGAVASAILDWSVQTRNGFSKFISLGNMADVTEVDVLRAWTADPEVRCAVAYLEGIRDGRAFFNAARDFTARKPLIAMKVGTTQGGRAAAFSHTGALAGSERVVDAALRQSGIVRALTMEELFDFTRCFAFAPLPAGPNVAIVTNAGGPGVMAADAVERLGLRLAGLSGETIERMRQGLPAAASLRNPVDLIGDADADRYRLALEAIAEDEAVHGIIALLTPQAVTEPEATARIIVNVAKVQDKPIMGVYMGGTVVERGRAILSGEHVPVYNYPERAVRSMEAMVRYADYRRSLADGA
ncbi:MAG TPA: CoA-binding protein, partial [Dehalococcoidia bacterium]|nr:CoA-binding protein [Dehalococcoidia bacterium]